MLLALGKPSLSKGRRECLGREREEVSGLNLILSAPEVLVFPVIDFYLNQVDAREFPGGLLRLDPAFAYAEPPSS